MMKHRERFIKTLNGEPTDRPPLYVSMVPQLAKRLSDHLGAPYEQPVSSLLGSRISFNNMLTGMGVDAIEVAACFPDNAQPFLRPDGITINEWGMGTKPVGLYDEFAIYPLCNNGGYILAPAHNIQDDTSIENVMAFFEAAKELEL